MTQAKPRFATFQEYLSYSDDLEGRFQLIDGELVELPPESELNNFIANRLQFLLVIAKVAPLRLIRIHALELLLRQGRSDG
ncbi:MAG: Uma2 family endonuclease [Cyanosarcina radialis HA8281-LM2]|jgi:Uma2 family endonuclease|nr:Uma2 family endonuclease [Cyanosarcina radialis HA8281-LM2]